MLRVTGRQRARHTPWSMAMLPPSWLFKGILVFLSFPLILVTFGLFHLVLNAFLLWVTDKILDSFEITSMKALAIGTVALTIGGAGVTLLVGH